MNIWFTSDTHFNHEKVLGFEKEHRPFVSIKEHDEMLIRRWNSLVGGEDKIYVLGDFFLGGSKDVPYFRDIASRLNGRKILIRGNHDLYPMDLYASYFEEIHGVLFKYGFVMSHVPLHPDSVERWKKNLHGHLHSQSIQRDWYSNEVWAGREPDPRYYCVSVEQHCLAPVPLEKLKKEFINVTA